jgi:hypothetical protein
LDLGPVEDEDSINYVELLDVALACEKIHTVKPLGGFRQRDIEKLIEARKGTLREMDLNYEIGGKEPLYSLAECTKLEKLKFEPHFDSIKILTSLESLNELRLRIPEEETFEHSIAPNSLPKISRLGVSVISADKKNCLIALANACPNLRYLYLYIEKMPINRCEQVLQEFFAKCPKLEVIDCFFSTIEEEKRDFLFLDEEFKDAKNCLPNLKILYFTGNCEIARKRIKEMILSSANNLVIQIDGSLYVQASTTAHEIAQLPLRLNGALARVRVVEIINV